MNNNNNKNIWFKELDKFFNELDREHNLRFALRGYLDKLELETEVFLTKPVKTYVRKIIRVFDERQKESTEDRDLRSLLKVLGIFLRESAKVQRVKGSSYSSKIQSIYRSLMTPKINKRIKWAAYEGQKAVYRSAGRKRKIVTTDPNAQTVIRRKITKEREEKVETLYERYQKAYRAVYGK